MVALIQNPGWSDLILITSLTWLHLQEPYFQIRSCSQDGAQDLDMYFEGFTTQLPIDS